MPYYLYKSDRKNKKYVMIMPEFSHSHNFGDNRYRDYTLISNKNSKYYIDNQEERDKVKKSYRARHSKDKGLNSPHSASALSWYILWSAPTLEGGIKNYEKRFNVKVVNRV